MKKIAMIVLLLFCALALYGDANTEQVVLSKYDVDGATYTYCALGQPVVGTGRIETSGSNATVTAVSGIGNAFDNVAVGDEITATSIALTSSVTFTVIAKASGTSITADRPINIDVTDGCVFTFRTLSCGTTAADGWFKIDSGTNHVAVIYRRGDLTGGVEVSLETRYRASYGIPLQIQTTTITTPATSSSYASWALAENANDWRIGLKYNTADPSDATTDLDQVDIIVYNRR
jgi:hypothetical protein